MPTLHDVIGARPCVYRYLKPTALYHYAGLSVLVGAEIWVKHENHQPVNVAQLNRLQHIGYLPVMFGDLVGRPLINGISGQIGMCEIFNAG